MGLSVAARTRLGGREMWPCPILSMFYIRDACTKFIGGGGGGSENRIYVKFLTSFLDIECVLK